VADSCDAASLDADLPGPDAASAGFIADGSADASSGGSGGARLNIDPSPGGDFLFIG
jgi:hypothetical protein